MAGFSHRWQSASPRPAGNHPWSLGSWHHGRRTETLANLAHELRTPVQAMLGYLDILRGDFAETLAGPAADMVERMNANAHDLALTVENVMDFVLAEARAPEEAVEDFDPVEIIDEIHPALEAANHRRRLGLRINLDEAPRIVRSRRRALRLILLNLALNAIKFTESGLVTLEIRAGSNGAERDALVIEVSDSGPGIDKAHLKYVFQPWRQLSSASARHYRGLGLGLSVVALNAQSLGAGIEVETAVGVGTRVRVTIPSSRPSEAAPIQPRRRLAPAGLRMARTAVLTGARSPLIYRR